VASNIPSLSAPAPHSINDYIDANSYSLTYCTIDNAYSIINRLGPNALLSKIDLKDAFRLIPVRPEDRNLLGIQWHQHYYVDTCLPFGLRSAPFLFIRLSDAIYWVLQHNYEVKHLLHYLDDFFTAGHANTDDCKNNLTAMLSLCNKINAPVKSSKVEGPFTSLTFLGILLNTTTMEASITQQRKQALISELIYLRHRRNCTKWVLLSLIGKLSFTCRVLPARHTFLRRLINLSMTVLKLHHHIPPTVEAKLDLQWWLNFLPGKSLILQTNWLHSESMQLYTDASGTWRWGSVLVRQMAAA